MHNLTLASFAKWILPVVLLTLVAGCVAARHELPRSQKPARAAMWVDSMRGEPMEFSDVVDDLATARVVYLGEIHTIARHHQLQTEILNSLASRGVKLVLAMEQFEYFAQPALDRYNAGAIDLDGLIRESNLKERWSDYADYKGLLLAARSHGIPVLALNARAETIRAIARGGGLKALSAEQRKELPASIVTDDPLYERLLKQTLAVHIALDPARLQPAFEAQVARDETMASRLAEYLNSNEGRGRSALVICGRGHCEFGFGIPSRVSRRIPGISQRIVVFSNSGDLRLSEEERSQARDIEVTHEFLQGLGRPLADYFQIAEPAR